MSFHDLHHQGVPFVLPNAWDVPSALAYLAEGFTAIGTTSFGVSSSGGHPDGHRATRGANIALAAALAAAKIVAIKQRNPEVFVNARVDTYWLRQHADTTSTIQRALRYVDAGADGVFVPLANDPDELAELTRNIPCPVNTLPVPGLTIADLGELGVARVSTGSVPYSAGLYAAAHAARAVSDGEQLPRSVPYAELQARLVDYENRTSTT